MRISHVVYECQPGAYAGGIQKMVFELATAQAAQGNEVEIWCIGVSPDLRAGENCIIRYFPGRVRWSSAELHAELKLGWRKFDVLHAHNTFLPLNLHVAEVARSGAKVFFHAHGALDPQLLSGWTFKALKKRLYVGLIERRNYDAARAVFGLTTTECQQLALMGTRTAIYEVSNGIGLQDPAPSYEVAAFRLRNRMPVGAPVILFIGRITHKKGLHYLIDAMPVIRARHSQALLVICGDREQDIDYVRVLDAQISRLKLEESVRWAGFLDERFKRAAFAACSLFVHPSYSEGMALAVLEAMAAGVPTIVTPGCYMGEAVKAGVLCESQQDSGSIAAAVAHLLSRPDEAAKLGAGALNYVRNKHAWSVVASRLNKIYAGDPSIVPYRAALRS